MGAPAAEPAPTPATEAAPANPLYPEGSAPSEPAPAEGEVAKPADGEAAPVTYELKIPEGVTLDPTAVASFTTFCQEQKVTPEVAQAFLDRHITAVSEATTALQTAQMEAWNKTNSDWKAELEADATFGGPKAEETKAMLAKAIDTYGSPETREALNFTGAGNNPAIVRMFAKMAAALSEGTPLPAPTPAPKTGATPAAKLYPTA